MKLPRKFIDATDITGTITPTRTKGSSEREAFLRASAILLKNEESLSSCSKPAPVAKATDSSPKESLTSQEGWEILFCASAGVAPSIIDRWNAESGSPIESNRCPPDVTLVSASGRLTPALLSSARSCRSRLISCSPRLMRS